MDEMSIEAISTELKRMCEDFRKRNVNPVKVYITISCLRRSMLDLHPEGTEIGDAFRMFDFITETPVNAIVGNA